MRCTRHAGGTNCKGRVGSVGEGGYLALLQLADAALDIASEVDHLEGGVLVQELCLPAESSRPNDGALRQVI